MQLQAIFVIPGNTHGKTRLKRVISKIVIRPFFFYNRSKQFWKHNTDFRAFFVLGEIVCLLSHLVFAKTILFVYIYKIFDTAF